MDEADSEVGADDVSVFANEGGAVVGVELVGEASAANDFFEGVVEALRVFARVVGGVGYESAVVVDDESEVGREAFAFEGDEFRARAEVGHPEIVWERGFEGFAGAVEVVVLGGMMVAVFSEEAIESGE